MAMTWIFCFCISPFGRCKKSIGDKQAELEVFQTHSAEVLKNLREYLAEEKFCVPGATEIHYAENEDATMLGRAFAICMTRQKAAFEMRDRNLFTHNRLASDLIALMSSLYTTPALPGAIARPTALQNSIPVLTDEARYYLADYIDSATHENLEIGELPEALAQGFIRAHSELRAASALEDAASSIHHLDLIVDIVQEMIYFWRNQNPHVHDPNVAAEFSLPEEHPHRRLVEARLLEHS